MTVTRRAALQLAASLVALPAVHSALAAAPQKLRLGLIGCGGMMSGHLSRLVQHPDSVSIGWLCDVDPRQMDAISNHLNGTQSKPPTRTGRFEEVLADPDVDACVIATPHHWHVPIAVRAMQAGKDVYVEKPMSHVYNEGPLMIAAAQKYGRIVQQGSQMRSSPVTLKAAEILKSGVLGEIKVARAWTAEKRDPFPALPDAPVPDGVDYDRWLGPAPVRPFNQRRFHGSWRMFRDYRNGEIGDDGIHDLDMAAWGLGISGPPSKITARGGRMMAFENASEYPDNMQVSYEYPDGRLLIYENFPFTEYGLHGFDNGNVFYGTEGYMVFSRRGAFSVFLGPKNKPGPTEGKELRGQVGYSEHMAEFLDAVRHRSITRANATTAHHSCALVHLGEIAFRIGRSLEFDPAAEKFIECPEADAMLTKDYRQPWLNPEVA
ncbi:MAG: Gfo/Idh/MocA family oxidoreductase [Pirellulales bacterium]